MWARALIFVLWVGLLSMNSTPAETAVSMMLPPPLAGSLALSLVIQRWRRQKTCTTPTCLRAACITTFVLIKSLYTYVDANGRRRKLHPPVHGKLQSFPFSHRPMRHQLLELFETWGQIYISQRRLFCIVRKFKWGVIAALRNCKWSKMGAPLLCSWTTLFELALLGCGDKKISYVISWDGLQRLAQTKPDTWQGLGMLLRECITVICTFRPCVFCAACRKHTLIFNCHSS